MIEQSPESLLLERWRDGDEAALNQLTPLVYDELKKLARSAFRREQGGHTLQATALVNEAYLQLINASVDWKGKAHFYALADNASRADSLLDNLSRCSSSGSSILCWSGRTVSL